MKNKINVIIGYIIMLFAFLPLIALLYVIFLNNEILLEIKNYNSENYKIIIFMIVFLSMFLIPITLGTAGLMLIDTNSS